MIEIVELSEEKTTATDRPLPSSLKALENLCGNYWWSWAADGTGAFRDLDPEIWEEYEHNPKLLLAKASDYRVAQMATSPSYINRVRALREQFDAYLQAPPNWRVPEGISSAHPVAYFCAEYGVHNSLPLYSGGLGMLAGDHLKSASDLQLPLLAIGLLYRYGYFRQRMRRDGWQEEYYGETHPTEMPIELLRDVDQKPLTIALEIRGRIVKAQVWRASVGRVSLYLLDTNIPENDETDRWVTGHLYGGDRETRAVQEMLLGIGGVRVLRRLGIDPAVYHLNEGHSAFLTLELARELIQTHQIDFETATQLVREKCVFTTHTPVAAGNDEFDAELIKRCFGPSYLRELGLNETRFLGLGKIQPRNDGERFGLTPLAIRMCRSTNGVSRKHGEVSRALWRGLWPDKPVASVPISHVTNGVHAPTWVAPLMRALYEKYVGPDWADCVRDPDRWAEAVAKIFDEELWSAHLLLKERLVAFVRHRAFHARLNRGESPAYTEAARRMFDPEALTIGFARRVAGYKRWDLLASDPPRLLRLLSDESRPVQFVFAGKAHPQDNQAKQILQQLYQWKHDPIVGRRAAFVQDYDQEIARQLVQSVDVWLNVPRRPLEASGTSGQKVAINGGLNLSILDGWWLEAYDGQNGFAIGDSGESGESEDMDVVDAHSLYRVLEEEVVPLYYQRDADDIPHQWIARMKRSIQTLVPQFNSDRMVAEYAERIYAPTS